MHAVTNVPPSFARLPTSITRQNAILCFVTETGLSGCVIQASEYWLPLSYHASIVQGRHRATTIADIATSGENLENVTTR